MIKYDMWKFSFAWNFYNKKMCKIESNFFLLKQNNCVIKTSEMFSVSSNK